MSGDIAAQDFCQTHADFKRKDTAQMIPIVIMAIEDESDRDYITGLFLKNERGMYAMALKIVKEHHTACDMVSESCLKMIEKIGYLREISVQKQTPYIYPAYIPEGFEFDRCYSSEAIYYDKAGNSLSFSEETYGARASLDTENANLSSVLINGAEATLIEKDGWAARCV